MKPSLRKTFTALVVVILVALQAACAAAPLPSPTPEIPGNPRPAGTLGDSTQSPTPALLWTRTPTPYRPPTETPTITPTLTATPRPTLAPNAWMNLPVIPAEISQTVLETYARGLELGNNPQAFSKIGDCEAVANWFLKDFDLGERFYTLGEYAGLQPVIDYYKGSFQRESLAAKAGFTAASALSPLWADYYKCEKNETPLECEYRVHKPSLAFIILGTNDYNHRATFEPNLRQVVERSLELGVVPVLVTKADNLEGDNSLNATIAAIANEYDVPLWNYWAAVQGLPNQGLQEDKAHLTWAPNQFDNVANLQYAWPVRNLNALQTLELIKNSLPTP